MIKEYDANVHFYLGGGKDTTIEISTTMEPGSISFTFTATTEDRLYLSNYGEQFALSSLQIQQLCPTLPSMSTTAYRYRYNGKEQLSRFSGRYDYGFRMYDAGVGRFLSVDPLTKKYPELSPYAAVANSPIAYKDMDGRDFELVINHDTREIIVKATYYVLESDKDTKAKLEKAVGVWNSQNKFKYTFESDNANVSYAIKFELSVTETKYLEDIQLTVYEEGGIRSNNVILNSSKTLMNYNRENYPQSFLDDSDNKQKAAAVTFSGNQILIDNTSTLKDLAHEIGHTLSIGHQKGDNLMSTDGGTGRIDASIVSSIIPMKSHSVKNRVDNSKPGKNTRKIIGTTPNGFSHGKISN